MAVLLLLPALACGPGSPGREGESPAVEAAFGEEFELSPGESALVEGGFRVTFARVSEDSRCAADVRCAEPGNAAAVFSVEGDLGSATLTVHTAREPQQAAAMGHALRLIALGPGPAGGALVDSTAYHADLVVVPAP